MKKLTVLLSILVLALGILAAGCGGGDSGARCERGTDRRHGTVLCAL